MRIAAWLFRSRSKHDLSLLKPVNAFRTVQELLGHQSVEAIQIYPHVMQKPGLGVRTPLNVP